MTKEIKFHPVIAKELQPDESVWRYRALGVKWVLEIPQQAALALRYSTD